jgi:hypothetical protein
MDDFSKKEAANRERRPWQAPALKPVGTIEKVLQGGGEKLSRSGGDPGDTRKQPPSG